jgi:telomere length regulation protein
LLLLQRETYPRHFEKLLDGLPSFELRNFIVTSLKLISKEYLSSIITSTDDTRWWQSDASLVSAAAGLVTLILGDDKSRTDHVVAWLTGSSGAGVGDGINIRRAAITALAADKTVIEEVLEKSLHQFGDQLYIKHTTAMQQEGTNMAIFMCL